MSLSLTAAGVHPLRRLWQPRFAALVAALATAAPAAAQDQVFYMPLPEAQLFQTLDLIDADGNAYVLGNDSSVILRTTKIAIANNGTLIYYDQAEGGYEADIVNPSSVYANPGNPNGTQIWGDGITANGAPPNVPSDLLNSGTVVILLNTSGDYDGGDKFAVVGRAGVVMGAYPTTIGTIFAGGTEVVSTEFYGTAFRFPVGDNLGTNDWEATEGYFLATQDNTTIYRNGISPVTINQGQSLRLTGLNRGDQVTATAPVGGMMLTADIGSTFEMRWEAILPVSEWTNDYVLAGINGDFTSATYEKTQRIVLYAESSITVSYELGNGTTGSITVDNTDTLDANPVGGLTNRLDVPANSGVSFTSPSGTSFWGVSVIGQVIDDWGVPLVPTSLTTESIVVPEGYGCTGGACETNSAGGYTLTADRSAVFITPVAATTSNITIYVDFDGLAGPRSPVSYVVGGLDTVRLLDADQDMTGALIYTLDGTKLVGAWGQFSTNSDDDYALDLGTITAPADAVIDYGDAPSSYGEAGHRITGNLYLGAELDFETGYAGNAAASFDDDLYNGGSTVQYATGVDVFSVTNGGNATGACDSFWTDDISSNGGGSYDRVSLQFSQLLNSGDWIRIRARSGDTDGDDADDEVGTVSFCNDANGNCENGTVTLTVEDPDNVDPGPDKYYDFEVPPGVSDVDWVRIVRNPGGGTFQVDCAATMKSPVIDDEDGAPRDSGGNLLLGFQPCTGGSTYTTYALVNNTSGSTAYLVGYIDWDRDGAFDADTNEESATVTVPTGTTNGVVAVIWGSVNAVPSNCGGETATYARFRLTTVQATAQSPTDTPGTYAPSGEIEDYEILANTMPVTIGSLSAKRDGERVRFEWTTATEVGNAGFNLHGKNAGGTWQRLNVELIPARGGGLEPQDYTATIEVPAGITEFFVEDVDLTGTPTGHRAFVLDGAGAAPPPGGQGTDGPRDL